MDIFFGYFVWGLILAAPLSWLVWRLRLQRFVPRFVLFLTLPVRRRVVHLPPQLGAIVIRGARQLDKVERR